MLGIIVAVVTSLVCVNALGDPFAPTFNFNSFNSHFPGQSTMAPFKPWESKTTQQPWWQRRFDPTKKNVFQDPSPPTTKDYSIPTRKPEEPAKPETPKHEDFDGWRRTTLAARRFTPTSPKGPFVPVKLDKPLKPSMPVKPEESTKPTTPRMFTRKMPCINGWPWPNRKCKTGGSLRRSRQANVKPASEVKKLPRRHSKKWRKSKEHPKPIRLGKRRFSFNRVKRMEEVTKRPLRRRRWNKGRRFGRKDRRRPERDEGTPRVTDCGFSAFPAMCKFLNRRNSEFGGPRHYDEPPGYHGRSEPFHEIEKPWFSEMDHRDHFWSTVSSFMDQRDSSRRRSRFGNMGRHRGDRDSSERRSPFGGMGPHRDDRDSSERRSPFGRMGPHRNDRDSSERRSPFGRMGPHRDNREGFSERPRFHPMGDEGGFSERPRFHPMGDEERCGRRPSFMCRDRRGNFSRRRRFSPMEDREHSRRRPGFPRRDRRDRRERFPRRRRFSPMDDRAPGFHRGFESDFEGHHERRPGFPHMGHRDHFSEGPRFGLMDDRESFSKRPHFRGGRMGLRERSPRGLKSRRGSRGHHRRHDHEMPGPRRGKHGSRRPSSSNAMSRRSTRRLRRRAPKLYYLLQLK